MMHCSSDAFVVLRPDKEETTLYLTHEVRIIIRP
jgi:hypothetical protein